MKKVWQAVVLVALTGLAINSYADVQNIRLSGDIRLRGYYTVNTDGDDVEDQVQNADSYIAQRTRVTVEADLEDHVLVVVTMKAEGLWGVDNENNDEGSTAGAGEDEVLFDADRGQISGFGADDRINRLWDLGITEAYVQFSEMFYSPVTLKLGRQYLHYGHGLIISSIEQEYNFDAARLVLDYYPLTIDLLYSTTEENSQFGGSTTGLSANDSHLLFANVRYEMSDSILKNIEWYFGWLINSRGGDESGGFPDDPLSADRRVPPSAFGASPMLTGLRIDLNLSENLELYGEGAYEWGPDGVLTAEKISAWIANAGARFTLRDVEMTPAFNVNYIYASGGGTDGENQFRPWFDYMEGYNGYLFAPILSNIHIFNVGASVNPYENTTLSLQAYYYMAADKGTAGGGAGLVGNPNLDNGGLGYSPTSGSRELGWEFDGIIEYDYSKDVTFQLVYAAFIPENSYQFFGSNRIAHEVRAEVNARF